MSVSFNGFNSNILTFKCNAKIAKGTPVNIFESNTVVAASDSDDFHGVVIDGDENYASVQVTGVVTLPYTGTAPETGFNSLGSDGNGGVKIASTSKPFLILATDETAGTVTFMM